MHRLLVDTALLAEEAPVLPADAAKHLRVVRPREGEPIELFDGRGSWRSYVYTRSGLRPQPDSRTIRTIEQSNNSLTLFACVTKGSRWDWTIEKATELGVTRIVPVISDRTIVRIPKAERAAKRERWLRIAEDAARQSDAKWLPEITETVDFKDSLALVSETTCFIGALTTPPSPLLAEALSSRLSAIEQSTNPTNRPLEQSTNPNNRTIDQSHLATFIGPEGDFTPDELAALMAIAVPVSFGPTVLRAETAAIFALSVILANYPLVKQG